MDLMSFPPKDRLRSFDGYPLYHRNENSESGLAGRVTRITRMLRDCINTDVHGPLLCSAFATRKILLFLPRGIMWGWSVRAIEKLEIRARFTPAVPRIGEGKLTILKPFSLPLLPYRSLDLQPVTNLAGPVDRPGTLGYHILQAQLLCHAEEFSPSCSMKFAKEILPSFRPIAFLNSCFRTSSGSFLASVSFNARMSKAIT